MGGHGLKVQVDNLKSVADSNDASSQAPWTTLTSEYAVNEDYIQNLSDSDAATTKTPRSDVWSEDTTSEAGREHDEYYAFLREMAGSFEVLPDDDEEEQGLEDEAEADGWSAEAASEASEATFDSEDEPSGLPGARARAASGAGPAEPSYLYGKFCGPVADDYDVVWAIADFAQRHPCSERRDTLVASAQLLHQQAASLVGPAGRPGGAHYAHIRAELLAEAASLEAELDALNAEARAAPATQQVPPPCVAVAVLRGRGGE